MPKSYSSREVIEVLLSLGFALRSTRGSHHKYVKGPHVVIVPHPKKDLRPGTLYSILKQAGLTMKDLES